MSYGLWANQGLWIMGYGVWGTEKNKKSAYHIIRNPYHKLMDYGL